MSFDPEAVMKRDNHLCRLRYPDCSTQATTVKLHTPVFLGGSYTDHNARAACQSCAQKLQTQRNRAAELLGEHAA